MKFRWRSTVMIVFGILYGVSLTVFTMPYGARSGIFVSPDEHATWIFAQQIAETGLPKVIEERNVEFRGLLVARSTVSMGNVTVPSGFLGMPYMVGALYVLSPILAAHTAPLLGVLGLFALYALIRQAKGSREFAIMSAVALAIHPAWWLYSMRSLMPNIPFVALLLSATWGILLVRDTKKYRGVYASSAGALVALALCVRASEWVWIAGLVVSSAWLIPVRAYKKEILSGIIGFLLVISGAFALNAWVYGSPLVTGYTVHAPVWEVANAYAGSERPSWFGAISSFFFPFGFHEMAIIRNVWNYLVLVYPWMTISAVIGAVFGGKKFFRFMCKQKEKKLRHVLRIAACGATLSAAYLIALYGSWTFFDNPDPRVVSLGNSHVRYWLPFAVVSAPLCAYALINVRDHFLSWAQSKRTASLAKIFPAAMLVVCATLSARVVFLSDDGVIKTRAALETFEEKRESILEATPEQAIIIVDRADKYLWPDRAVVVPLRSEKTYAAIPAMLKQAPVYYFGITLPEEDIAYLQEHTLKESEIIFEPVMTINEETLYVIHR